MGKIIDLRTRPGATVIRLLLGAASVMAIVLGIASCVLCLIGGLYLFGRAGILVVLVAFPLACLLLKMACGCYESLYRLQESLVRR